MVRAQMIRVQANMLAVLVSALSVASIFMTHTLFTVVNNVEFETRIMKKEYSQFRLFLFRREKLIHSHYGVLNNARPPPRPNACAVL